MYAEGHLIVQVESNFQPVSFVIPAHNEAKFIGRTIKKLKAAIAEVNCESEIIVVNDDSTDDTASVARSAGAQVIDVALRNIGAVRNAGAKTAQHPWLFFIDADTFVPAETLRQSLEALARGDVGGGSRVDLSDEQPIFFVKRLMYYAVVLFWQIIGRWAAGCFMFCRKEKFESFGGFDEQYLSAEEMFFSKQLKRLGKFKLVQHPVITSARKLQRYSVWELVKFVISTLLGMVGNFKSKRGLEILYEDNR
ncbi:MAG: glycosyltransferase [Mariniblastus sp.]